MADIGEKFRLGLIGCLRPDFLLVVAFREFAELPRLNLQLSAALFEAVDFRPHFLLPFKNLALAVLRHGNVCANTDQGPVPSPIFADLQPDAAFELLVAKMKTPGRASNVSRALRYRLLGLDLNLLKRCVPQS